MPCHSEESAEVALACISAPHKNLLLKSTNVFKFTPHLVNSQRCQFLLEKNFVTPPPSERGHAVQLD